jgi:hypothetical protein
LTSSAAACINKHFAPPGGFLATKISYAFKQIFKPVRPVAVANRIGKIRTWEVSFEFSVNLSNFNRWDIGPLVFLVCSVNTHNLASLGDF